MAPGEQNKIPYFAENKNDISSLRKHSFSGKSPGLASFYFPVFPFGDIWDFVCITVAGATAEFHRTSFIKPEKAPDCVVNICVIKF